MLRESGHDTELLIIETQLSCRKGIRETLSHHSGMMPIRLESPSCSRNRGRQQIYDMLHAETPFRDSKVGTAESQSNLTHLNGRPQC